MEIKDLKASAYDKMAEIEYLAMVIKQKQSELDQINQQIRVASEVEKDRKLNIPGESV